MDNNERKFPRREFFDKTLKGGIAIAGAGGAAAVLGACGSSASPTASASGAAAGRSNASLHVGILGFPVDWDSAIGINNSTFLFRNVLDPLVQLTSSLNPQPALASSWSTNSGATVWDFTLVRNAEWHDGVPFTSKDVVTHFKRILNPKTGSAGLTVYGEVGSVEAVGDYGVRFTLKVPDASFPSLLGLYQGNIQAAHLNPKHYGTKPMVGTGPFKWGTVVPGQSITLVRNDKYFAKGEPAAASLEFVVFSDDEARRAALVAGAIDVAPDVGPSIADNIKGVAGFTLTQSIPGGHTAIYLRADRTPGHDPRVMQAFKLTLDRPSLVKGALSGYGIPTGDNPVVPGSSDYYALPVPSQDIAKAKELLAAAGYSSGGPTINCYVPGGDPRDSSLALGLQSMAEQAGFKVNITTVPGDLFFAKYWPYQNFGVDDWGARPTVDSQFRIAYSCGGIWNESHWCDPTFDSLLNRGRAELNATARQGIYKELQQYFAEHSNAAIPYHYYTLSPHSNSVNNFTESPIQYYTDFRTVSKS